MQVIEIVGERPPVYNQLELGIFQGRELLPLSSLVVERVFQVLVVNERHSFMAQIQTLHTVHQRVLIVEENWFGAGNVHADDSFVLIGKHHQLPDALFRFLE